MNEKIKMIEGGVTAAKGFMAASTAAGIKYKNRQDMAMIYSKQPCKSAGTFTTNLVKAAPVKWDKNQVTSGADAQAVIINAGIANACTGEEGMGYCAQTATVSYTHLRAHETPEHLVCRLLPRLRFLLQPLPSVRSSPFLLHRYMHLQYLR